MRMTIYSLLIFVICSCHGQEASKHPGHLQAFGVGLKTLPVATRDDMPDPIEFFDSYIARSKPVIFKGVAKSFPNYNNLRNDSYLGEKYGTWNITYEPNTKEIREKKINRMSFRKFTQIYSKNKFYMVSDIITPNPLRQEIRIPKPLLCDDLAGRMETCIMWFSAGGTRSLLHSDSQDNLNCLYDGVKELYIAHPKHQDKFYYRDGSFSTVDVDKVDFEKYPNLLRIPWHYVKMEPGDCLFIPYQWVHHIKSHGPRNFAVNLFWDHLLSMPSREKCQAEIKDLEDTGSLTNYEIEDKYERARSQWIVQVFEQEPENMEKDRMCSAVIHASENHDIKQEQCERFFHFADKDQNGFVSRNELYRIDVKYIKPLLQDMVGAEEDGEIFTHYEEVDPKVEEAENKKEEL